MTTLVPPPPNSATTPGPFGVAVAAGNWGFATGLPVAITATKVVRAGSASPPPLPTPSPPPPSFSYESGVDVLRLAPGHAAVQVRSIGVPGPTGGAALSKNGRLLLVASGAGATVISVPAAEQGGRHALLGMLAADGKPIADNAVEVAITPDGRYAFVALKGANQIAVFNLARAVAHGFRSARVYVGSIPAQGAPVGLAVSPDGRWLYAATDSDTSPVGMLSVISVATAESDPARSVVATVPVGCTVARVITSADGSVVWVTGFQSNALLAFSAASLQTDSSHALLADVHVGRDPIGLALARDGTLIVVADSDRLAAGFPPSNIAVVNVGDALHGRPALLGYLPAGRYPRDVATSGNGNLVLVANYDSGQVEAVNPAALP